VLELTTYVDDELVVLEFEHSLVSLSKWESKFKKVFLSKEPHTFEEMIDYYGFMLVTPGVRREVVYGLSPEQLLDLRKHIDDAQTATILNDEGGRKGDGEVLTNEVIYYYLKALKIPFHPTETWHVNRIMTLIALSAWKDNPPKEKPAKQQWAEMAAENERRRKMLQTNG